MSQTTVPVIAIDGPAASGKGTLGRRLAAEFGFHHLDTGLTYRAVALKMLNDGSSFEDEAIAEKAAREIDLGALERTVLAAHRIGELASRVAVMARVRAALIEAQRQFAAMAPGTVLDGRDIGTVVCPNASVKLFVTASPQARARRRHREIVAGGGAANLQQVVADLIKRDERDMRRADSPLKPADDAYLIDTTEMDIETAYQAALAMVKQSLAT